MCVYIDGVRVRCPGVQSMKGEVVAMGMFTGLRRKIFGLNRDELEYKEYLEDRIVRFAPDQESESDVQEMASEYKELGGTDEDLIGMGVRAWGDDVEEPPDYYNGPDGPHETQAAYENLAGEVLAESHPEYVEPEYVDSDAMMAEQGARMDKFLADTEEEHRAEYDADMAAMDEADEDEADEDEADEDEADDER